MTTIAWDGKSMAADSMCCIAGYLRSTSHKLTRCGDYIYGNTGNASEKPIIVQWLKDGAREITAPTMEDSDGRGLVVHVPSKSLFIVEGKRATLVPIHEPFWAAGEGRDFAIAAMYLGKSAREAVEIAIRFSVGSGGEVEVIDVYPEHST